MSLAIRFLTTSAHTTPHCPSLRLMRTHAYICGHMHTQRHTQGPYVPTRVHKRTLRERAKHKLTKSLLRHLFTINNPSCSPQVMLPHSNTHIHIHNNNCLTLRKHLDKQSLPRGESYLNQTCIWLYPHHDL